MGAERKPDMPEKEKKGPCMLPESQRQCAGGVGYEAVCRNCGWFETEYRRRLALPLVEGENGLRVRKVGKPPEENQI